MFLEKNCTNKTATYTQWLIVLIAVICEEVNLTPYEIALNEDEVKGYFDNGETVYNVFHNIWEGDAGNYYAI